LSRSSHNIFPVGRDDTGGIRVKPIPLLLWVCVGSLYLILYGPVFPGLVQDWFNYDTFSFGLLIPFISAYFLWRTKDQLSITQAVAAPWVAVVLLLSVGLGLVGKAVGDTFTMRVAMVATLGSLVWLLLGQRIFRVCLFPIGYLFLMIPLPYVLVKEVAYHLRIVDAVATAVALQTMGIPVYRDSYFLHLPGITLEVADLCSGISSVFALFALGAAYVYMLPLRPSLKILAVMSTIPFAALVNVLRIILTSALAYYFGPAVLGALVHELTGTITFFIALFLFVVLVEVFQRMYTPAFDATARFADVHSPGVTDRVRAEKPYDRRFWVSVTLALMILVPASYVFTTIGKHLYVALFSELDAFPEKIGTASRDGDINVGMYSDTNAETSLSRTYKTFHGKPVTLYIGYMGNQFENKRLKSPKLVFPYGWNFVWVEAANIGLGKTHSIEANWMLTQSGETRHLVLYWYQTGGTSTASESAYRLQQVKRMLLQGRSDAAVVRVATPVYQDESIERTKQRLKDFAVDLHPALLEFLPK